MDLTVKEIRSLRRNLVREDEISGTSIQSIEYESPVEKGLWINVALDHVLSELTPDQIFDRIIEYNKIYCAEISNGTNGAVEISVQRPLTKRRRDFLLNMLNDYMPPLFEFEIKQKESN